MKGFKAFILLLLVLVFASCDSKKVHYDRDICERCKMIISDRSFATEVASTQNAKKYYFDDIGCAILWFKEQNISWQNEAKIQVVDFDTKKWIDAKSAFYSSPNMTPMSYGFAAHSDKSKIAKDKNISDFTQMRAKILEIGK